LTQGCPGAGGLKRRTRNRRTLHPATHTRLPLRDRRRIQFTELARCRPDV